MEYIKISQFTAALGGYTQIEQTSHTEADNSVTTYTYYKRDDSDDIYYTVSQGPPSSGGDGSGSGDSSGGGGADYTKYTPPSLPVAPPPAAPPTGFYNPVTNTTFALNTPPARNSVFNNPLNAGGFKAPSPMLIQPGSGISIPQSNTPGMMQFGNGGTNPNTSWANALINPAHPKVSYPGSNTSSDTTQNSKNDNSENNKACYLCEFDVDDCGSVQKTGTLNIWQTGADDNGKQIKGQILVASCPAIAGCNDPIHYGPIAGTFFKPVMYIDEGSNFKITLNPQHDYVDNGDTRIGPFYVFKLGDDDACTHGAIGIRASGDKLDTMKKYLKRWVKCKTRCETWLAVKCPKGQDGTVDDDRDTTTASSKTDSSNKNDDNNTTAATPTKPPIPIPPNPVTDTKDVIRYINGQGDTDKPLGVNPIPEPQPKKPNKPISKSSWDKDAAVTALDNNANDKSQGKCAKYIRLALNAGEIKTPNNPVPAYKYAEYLKQLGFEEVDSANYKPEKADVVVFEPFEGKKKDHRDGHIQMWDGNQWVSDFIQKHFWPGTDFENATPHYRVFRKN